MVHFVGGDLFNMYVSNPTSDIREFLKHATRIVIVHVVNDRGACCAGFFKALATKYPHAKRSYYNNAEAQSLGSHYLDMTYDNLWVAHLCAQHGLPSKDNPQPLSYWALDSVLSGLAAHLRSLRHPGTLVVMPRIGAGLARGNWNKIKDMIIGVDWCVPVLVFEDYIPSTSKVGGN